MKSKKNKKVYKKALSYGLVIIVALGVFDWAIVQYLANKQFNEQTGASEIRSRLLDSISELSWPAPREARTGDYYFPEAKLYLPNSESLTELNYSFDDDTSNEKLLRINSREMTNVAYNRIMSANTFESVFDKLPMYQACARGVTIADQEISDSQDLKLAWKISTNDGRKLHAYTENSCPAHQDTVKLLKDIRSYN